jgi:hypothetical protein
MHAKLEPLCPSLKHMDYMDFMTFLRVFFGLTYLINKGEIYVCEIFNEYFSYSIYYCFLLL